MPSANPPSRLQEIAGRLTDAADHFDTLCAHLEYPPTAEVVAHRVAVRELRAAASYLEQVGTELATMPGPLPADVGAEWDKNVADCVRFCNRLRTLTTPEVRTDG